MRKTIIIALMALVAAFAFAFADETTDTLSTEVLTLYAGDGIDFTVVAGDVLTLPDGTQEVVTGTLADGLCTLSYTFAVDGECSIGPGEGETLSVYSCSLEPSGL